MSEDKSPDEIFEEILERANGKVRADSTRLMDLNHASIMASREIINKLRDFRDRYFDIIENLIMAHGIACKEISDLYGDQILSEQGLVEATEEEPEEEQ